MSKGPQFARLAVGVPFPYPVAHQGEGMVVSVSPGDQAPDIMLVVKLASPTPAEIRVMTKDPLRIAVTPSPPLVWFTLLATKMDLDAPYGVAIETKAAEIRASFAQLETAGP